LGEVFCNDAEMLLCHGAKGRFAVILKKYRVCGSAKGSLAVVELSNPENHPELDAVQVVRSGEELMR
jgi:hypothetical protein